MRTRSSTSFALLETTRAVATTTVAIATMVTVATATTTTGGTTTIGPTRIRTRVKTKTNNKHKGRANRATMVKTTNKGVKTMVETPMDRVGKTNPTQANPGMENVTCATRRDTGPVTAQSTLTGGPQRCGILLDERDSIPQQAHLAHHLAYPMAYHLPNKTPTLT